jgi:hypothetical protein
MKALSLALGVLLLLVSVVGAHAQTGSSAGYDLTWWTVDGGGGTCTTGSYSLTGTIGQSDTGAMNGGDYTLAGGFWGGDTAPSAKYKLYLPLVLRQHS